MNLPPPYAEDSSVQSIWRPRVLVLDDEWSTLERIKASLADEFEVTSLSRAEEAIKLMAKKPFDVVLTDVRMPDMNGLSLVTELKERWPKTQYILMTAFSDIEDTISALRLGVADYLRKPFTDGEVRHALHRCLEHQRLKNEVASLRTGRLQGLANVITQDRRMRELCQLAETVAPVDVIVLISGETGTGKGLLARTIHRLSRRRERPFVKIDCASVPATLIESELFGHERGSFTGAVARKLGRVEVAEGGTLLLDEVGDMPTDMQAKLLRFLQSFNFERVGGTKRLHADVRVIASTNRDLWNAVLEGRFRQDLFYRLHVIHLHLPPLRQRPADIPLLAEHFRQHFAAKYQKEVHGFSSQAAAQMLAHSWPGNVRELEHAVERAVVLCRRPLIEKLELALSTSSGPSEPPAGPDAFPAAAESSPQDLAGFISSREKDYLASLLRKYRGRIGDTARAAGINPKTLYLKMERHGLKRQDFRPAKTPSSPGRLEGA
jgi:DNA-binding NtrC family response regulator